MSSLQEIQEKALMQFAKYGLRSVNMDDIADFAGISKKTLYEFYDSKEKLIRGVFDDIRSRWETELDGVKSAPLDPVNKIMSVYKLCFKFIESINPAVLLRSGRQYGFVSEEMDISRKEVEELLSSLLDEAKANGLIKEGYELAFFAHTDIMLLDYLTEQINPLNSEVNEKLFHHIIFPRFFGILNEKKVQILHDRSLVLVA